MVLGLPFARSPWLTYGVARRCRLCGPLCKRNYAFSMECGLAMELATTYRDGSALE